ncbi:MAG: M64 family metallopeptidase [Bacteroidia bacterium]
MNKKLLLILTVFSLALNAQIYNVDTLLYNGNPNKRINLVILSDGYTNAQLPQFVTNATTMSNYWFSIAPFSLYKNYFNVFIIKVPSVQSGVSHPGTATDVTEPVIPVSSVNNYFGSAFDYYNIHRLLVPNNSSTIYSVLAANFPNYDLPIVIGNSTEYGGSGGGFCTVSINSNSNEIFAHESGHTFGGLADEYWAGPTYAIEKPNMTAQSNPTLVKWAPWVGINSIGVYPYGTSSPQSGWYRPHQNCKMQFLGSPFCSVCEEALIEKIHSLTNPIDSFAPINTSTITATASPITFKSFLLKPLPNTLKRTWKLNGNTQVMNVDSTTIANSSFVNGNNTVSITVIDTTILSKSATHPTLHTYSVIWNVNKSSAGITSISGITELSTFPNPANDVLTVRYTLQNESDMEFQMLTDEGRVVSTTKVKSQSVGEHDQKIDLANLAKGNYFLQCTIDKKVILNKILVIR